MSQDELVNPTQPSYSRGRPKGIVQYHGGGPKSVRRMAAVGFDPIGELVKNYRKLEAEVERQEKIRDNLIVELSTTGKPKAYRAEVHHALYDRLISVGEKLLRYKYGRVPETAIVEEKKAMPLVVNLTRKGDQYVINDNSSESEEAMEAEQEELDDFYSDQDAFNQPQSVSHSPNVSGRPNVSTFTQNALLQPVYGGVIEERTVEVRTVEVPYSGGAPFKGSLPK